MSRLIVKNLPKGVTDGRLKELFSQKGVVTDVQLKYTKDGKFRHFCFIGFKTEPDAQRALEYFNNTCIDTARITVDVCAGLGDAAKPKAWSKYAPDSSARTNVKSGNEAADPPVEQPQCEKKVKTKSKKQKDNIIKEAFEKHKDDPLFAEFLESHATAGTKSLWGNDATIQANASQSSGDDNSDDNESKNEDKDDSGHESEESHDDKVKAADKNISDLEYMQMLKNKQSTKEVETEKKTSAAPHGPLKLFTVKIRGLGYNQKKKHIKQFFHPLVPKSIRVPPKIKGIAYVGFKTEKQMKQALNKNKSFLAGKRLLVVKYEEKEKEEESCATTGKPSNFRWKEQEESLKSEESIAESGRMFIRNLAYTTTEDDVKTLFEKYGPLSEVNLPIDKTTRKPKGFGVLTFMMPEHAVKAYAELDGSILNGRMLHILPGKGKPDQVIDTDGLNYKQKKELLKKVTANSSHNWNTLFLGQNAVAEAIAAAYNTTKEKVLEDGSKGTSVAVRLALGETQLVENTRKFLEESGVRLDAFNQPAEKRSKTVILVKNLPAQTEVREIREMFARHGELGRIIMPPSGITALVEFLEPSEARKAFRKLAYTKFKYLPLYLEWAPDNSFASAASKAKKSNEPTDTGETTTVTLHEKDKPIVEETKETQSTMEPNSDDEEEAEPDTTLFVKNINFSTTEDTLREHFARCGTLHYVSIATKKDPKNPGEKLSMGYGFVRYKRKVDTDQALKDLQMTALDGKTLELKRSERTLQSDIATAKKTSKVTAQTGTKILVRNIPFQANANEVQELFKAFGEIKALRLPKKMAGSESHRGFAFVDYHTKSDAKRAFKALCQSTHLYGRRLALEWAQAEEGIDDIRKRTAKHFHQDESSKRSKKSTLDPETVGLDAE